MPVEHVARHDAAQERCVLWFHKRQDLDSDIGHQGDQQGAHARQRHGVSMARALDGSVVDQEGHKHERHVDADAAYGGADKGCERSAGEKGPGGAAAGAFDVNKEDGGGKDVEDELEGEEAEGRGMGVGVEGGEGAGEAVEKWEAGVDVLGGEGAREEAAVEEGFDVWGTGGEEVDEQGERGENGDGCEDGFR